MNTGAVTFRLATASAATNPNRSVFVVSTLLSVTFLNVDAITSLFAKASASPVTVKLFTVARSGRPG